MIHISLVKKHETFKVGLLPSKQSVLFALMKALEK